MFRSRYVRPGTVSYIIQSNNNNPNPPDDEEVDKNQILQKKIENLIKFETTEENINIDWIVNGSQNKYLLYFNNISNQNIISHFLEIVKNENSQLGNNENYPFQIFSILNLILTDNSNIYITLKAYSHNNDATNSNIIIQIIEDIKNKFSLNEDIISYEGVIFSTNTNFSTYTSSQTVVQFLNLIYGQYSSEPIIIEETNFGVFENNTNTINGFIYHIFLISKHINLNINDEEIPLYENINQSLIKKHNGSEWIDIFIQ